MVSLMDGYQCRKCNWQVKLKLQASLLHSHSVSAFVKSMNPSLLPNTNYGLNSKVALVNNQSKRRNIMNCREKNWEPSHNISQEYMVIQIKKRYLW